MWIWSERTYRPTSKKPHGKNPQAIKFLIFQFLYFPYLLFDHHWTTTVQWCCKMSKKPVVTTNNGLFPVLGAAVQNQQNLRFIDGLYRPVVVLRQLRQGRFWLVFVRYSVICACKNAVVNGSQTTNWPLLKIDYFTRLKYAVTAFFIHMRS